MKIILFILFSSFFIFAQKGILTGKIVDAGNEEPLIGVNIVVNELEKIGTASDTEGNFILKLENGAYSLKFSLIGYQSVVKTDVIIRSGNETYLNIKLSQSSLELDEVKVSADYFDKSTIENPLSAVSLDAEEVRRSPGSSQDFQRILQAMTGVSFSNDQNNELLVRGGSPNENLTVLDNIEIHSTNHYPNEYNSGGPINMVNVELLEDIQFSTGGFNSKYGDKLSSVITLNTREGTRNRILAGVFNFSMAGIGAVLEGGINSGRGSWILSARKSYIDLIASGFGLTAIPHYYDIQFKAAYDLASKQKITLVGIYGNDKITIDGETDKERPEFSSSIDSIDVEFINVKQYQYAFGATLKSLWNKDLYSIITVSNNRFNSKLDVGKFYTERIFDENGKVKKNNKLSYRNIFNESSENGETALRTEFVFQTYKNWEVNFGGAVKFIQYYNQQTVDADTTRYDINEDGIFDAVITQEPVKINYNFDPFKHNKNYIYINNKIKTLNDRLIFNLGFRYDTFTYSKKSNISPRVSLSYQIIPLLSSINFAYGEYFQTQSLPLYGDRYQSEVNRYLDNSLARHFVLGYEQILDEGLKLNIEGYYKKYEKLPFSEEFINFNDRTFRSEKIVNVGNKRIFGLDFLIQKKLVENYYGTISVSRMWTELDDPRLGFEGKTFISENDFPWVATIILGKRFKDLRKELDELPFYIKYPTMLLPFSDDMEISFRWRYASGKPYTPRFYSSYEQNREGGSKWTDGAWITSDDINSERYPDYHRLDIGFNSRYNFKNFSMNIFLSIQNLYNRDNIAFYVYNSDGTTDNVYQFQTIPLAGIDIEF